MPRTTIIKDVDISHVNFEQFISNIKEKKLTALALIKSWDYEDYLYYIEGKAYKGLRLFSESSCQEIEISGYRPSTNRATIAIFGLPISEICWLSLEQTSTEYLNGIGNEYLPTTRADTINLQTLLQKIEDEGIHGYMTVYDILNKSITNTIIFLNGKPVFAKSEVINLDTNSFIWVYATEPEVASVMASAMKSLRRFKRLTIPTESHLDKVLSSIKRTPLGVMLELNLCDGVKHICIYHSGVEVLSVLKRLDQLLYEPIRFHSGEKQLNIYVFDLDKDYRPVLLKTSSDKKQLEGVDAGTLKVIKEAFIQEIGPVGPIIWNKITKEFGEIIPKDLLGDLIEQLAKEIPDEKHRDTFSLKVKRYLP